MQLMINTPDEFHASREALEEHARRELKGIERRFGEWLTRIELFVRDASGPTGAPLRECRMEARPRGLDPVSVSNTGSDVFVAISGAADKLEKALTRLRGRHRAR